MPGFRDLKAYSLAFEFAMQVFEETKHSPKEERFSLADQIRRSSRSVAANIAEGYRRREYRSMFLTRLHDADAEAAETQTWLDFAWRCAYFAPERHQSLIKGYEELGRILGAMIREPHKFGTSQ